MTEIAIKNATAIFYLIGVLIFLTGLVFGSFLNVVIYRLPLEKSIIRPRSFCPVCGAPIAFYDNVPVLSFLLLRGKCRSCSAKISPVYPLVELLTGVSFFLSFYFFGISWKALEIAVLLASSIAITFIDLKHRIIPDEINIFLFVFAVFLPKEIWGVSYWPAAGLSALSGLSAGLVLFLIAIAAEKIFKQEAMGMGDVKLITALGAFSGFHSIFWLIFISSLIGSVVGIAVKLRKREKGYTMIAFGPYLCAAAIIYTLFEPRLKLLF
ncbi:prepilin peptidase [bacterium]|nr:prepilin peptidase [bacterium]MBU2528598.1 prepilin peptidase [bacterium]